MVGVFGLVLTPRRTILIHSQERILCGVCM
uniref:Uncharacterized protein n=1 Tax=Anguilla anguilla TaxID=7936 RepID=A0A0E9UWS2_ANGAN